MAISDNQSAFVDASSESIGLSQMFSVTAGSSDPAYLVLTALDRDEYTAGASGATGTLSGDGQTLGLSAIGGDGRGAGIVFTYNATTGEYYNSTYGYLNQVTFNSSTSSGDVTNLSLFGTNSLSLADNDAGNAMSMMEFDASGYIGSATVVTQPGYTATVPSQATPDSIAATAETFVGDAWNLDGCWVLASTIAAESGTSLPVQSTLIGLSGQDNGEWIVAFNGAGGQSGNWQSMVTAGEMIVIGNPGGGGHITTCVSGSGSTAMLVDNATYENGSGQVTNPANDGSSNDILIASPHLASQEWAGVSASTVVIYELDTPIVTAGVTSDTLASGQTQSLGSLFAATDPGNKAIVSWQVYNTATSDSLVLGTTDYSDHSAADALTASTLSSISLLAGSSPTTDTLEVRAYNGSYWGDWDQLSVAIAATAPTIAEPPVLATQTASQTWTAGSAISLALPAGTFSDPQSETLTYAATLSNGQALPGWLAFNAGTDSFSGTAPLTAETLTIKVTATDTSDLSAFETFSATVIGAPVVSQQTPGQVWSEGKAVSLALPVNTFTDPQNETLTYAATLSNGQALPGWLSFNAKTETFSGTAPATAQTLDLKVTATDTSGLSVSETFLATVNPLPPVLTAQTANQTWKEGQAATFVLPANTFTDPTGETLTYSAKQEDGLALPGWLTFNATTETFSFTPPNAAQTVDITVTATDTSGLSATDTFVATVLGAPVVSDQTQNQVWSEGQAFSLALPAKTFTDPQGESLTYTATLSNGQALPGWLTFNAATDSFAGTAPAMAQTVDIKVTATDTAGLSTSEAFAASVQAPAVLTRPGITVTNPTPNQVWTDGQSVALTLPANTFTDALGMKMSFVAYELNGPNVTSWLSFNPSTEELFGTVPKGEAGTATLAVYAFDKLGMTAEDLFSVTFEPSASASKGLGAAILGVAQPVDVEQMTRTLLAFHH